MENIKQGEAVIFTASYDLFDTDVMGMEGMFYKKTSEDKCLVYVPSVDEWAEPKISIVKQKKPGHIPRKYANLCKHIRELQITA